MGRLELGIDFLDRTQKLAHSSLIHNGKKSRKTQMSVTDEWIVKIWSIHTIEYYSSLKRNEVLTYVTMWMSLKNMMLSERSQSQKAMC